MKPMKPSTYTDPLDWIGGFVMWVTNQLEAFVRWVAYLLSGDVVVGFATHLDPDQRHGMAFFETANGRTELPFKVDRPENLDSPSRLTVQSIFDQIERMGQPATEIEITSVFETRVYRNGEAKPIFVHRH